MAAMTNTGRKRRSEAGRSGGIFVLSEDDIGIPVYTYHPDYYFTSIASSYSFNTVNSISVPIFVDENTSPSIKAKSFDGTFNHETERPQESDSGSSDLRLVSNLTAAHTVLEDISGNKQSSHHKDHKPKPRWFNSASKITHSASIVLQHTKARLSTMWPKVYNSEHAKAVDNIYCMEITTEEAINSNITPRAPPLRFADSTQTQYEPDTPDFGHGYFSTTEEYLQAKAAMRSFWPVTDSNEVDSLGSAENIEIEAPRKDVNTPTLAAAYEIPRRDTRTHYEVLGLSQHCNDKEITSRARRLMSKLHPDRFSSRTKQEKIVDAQEFARVSLAKTELLDAELRAFHDRDIVSGIWEGVPNC